MYDCNKGHVYRSEKINSWLLQRSCEMFPINTKELPTYAFTQTNTKYITHHTPTTKRQSSPTWHCSFMPSTSNHSQLEQSPNCHYLLWDITNMNMFLYNMISKLLEFMNLVFDDFSIVLWHINVPSSKPCEISHNILVISFPTFDTSL